MQEDVFGDVIYSYTRAEAIEDGELVDVSSVAREAGIIVPVAITRAVFIACVEWTDYQKRRFKTPQDEDGRLWDVLWMLRFGMRGSTKDTLLYRLVCVSGVDGRRRTVTLKATIGPGDAGESVVTVMLPEED